MSTKRVAVRFSAEGGDQVRAAFEGMGESGEREMRRIRSREIAMIFQDPMTSLNPVTPVGRQISETLKLHLGMSGAQARSRAASASGSIE